MNKNLAGLLTVLLVQHVNNTSESMNTSSTEHEVLEQMFMNNNFTSIEYWIESKLKRNNV